MKTLNEKQLIADLARSLRLAVPARLALTWNEWIELTMGRAQAMAHNPQMIF
jgi:hypothetical protein